MVQRKSAGVYNLVAGNLTRELLFLSGEPSLENQKFGVNRVPDKAIENLIINLTGFTEAIRVTEEALRNSITHDNFVMCNGTNTTKFNS